MLNAVKIVFDVL